MLRSLGPEGAQRTAGDELTFILPTADAETVRQKGFRNLASLNWGETRQFDAGTGSVTITAVRARHSHNPLTAQALGIGNGYWIEFSQQSWKRTLYWTGDTMPTDDVLEEIRPRGVPDIMVPHVGGVGTAGPFGRISMGSGDVVRLASVLRPQFVLPIHHSTYAFYREPISDLVAASKGKPYRLDLIAEGSEIIYP
ncbi:MBL fold metallo-hydrolase [Microvirga pakistanensis]|uniref:MBL fold metallo-hydrolase n=1 Tax=Microvirga pakistanensis TaxID=1682650 RepID=UPI00141B6104|nr:MBL fold metallo-hydrolase [Microvirga pakistanensis]